jgi:hypothetical protein
MKITKNLGFLLLGIWLIVSGASGLVDLPIPSLGLLLSCLAIVSGLFILMGK